MFSRFPIYYASLKQCAAPTTVITLYIYRYMRRQYDMYIIYRSINLGHLLLEFYLFIFLSRWRSTVRFGTRVSDSV